MSYGDEPGARVPLDWQLMAAQALVQGPFRAVGCWGVGCGDAAERRATVEAWVREYMPKGSELGFSMDELARLNHRRPHAARFDPYGTASQR
jgi:hypothetical protein